MFMLEIAFIKFYLVSETLEKRPLGDVKLLMGNSKVNIGNEEIYFSILYQSIGLRERLPLQ